MSDHYDVVIIGGGPAGSLTASLLRRQDPDRSVRLFEGGSHPRHHVGESSIAGWRHTLERAGLLEKVRDAGFMWKVGTLFHWGQNPDESWTIDFRDFAHDLSALTSWQLDRARFDELCYRHCAELGTDVSQGEPVREVRREGAGFQIVTDTTICTADFVVDASGVRRFLAKTWSLPVRTWTDLNNYAVYGYWRGSKVAQYGDPIRPDQRWTYIGTTRDGWLWHIPIAEDLVSVGLVTDQETLRHSGIGRLHDLYQENLAASAHVADLLETATLVQHPLAKHRLNVIQDWTWATDQTAGDGWFLVGDAAAFVDPIFSTGLLFTAHGASMVANALHTIWNDPAVDRPLLQRSYDATYKHMTETYYALAKVWYTRNFTVDSLHWESKRRLLERGSGPSVGADTFNQLLLGAFASPLDGSVVDPTDLMQVLSRREAKIYLEHMFDARESDGLREVDSQTSVEVLRRRARATWQRLYTSPVRVEGVEMTLADRYYTTSAASRWDRYPHLHVTVVEASDFPDLTLPIPDGRLFDWLGRLDGEATVAATIDAFLGEHPDLAADEEAFVTRCYMLLNFFAENGWLAGIAEQPYAIDLPEPVEEVLQQHGLLAATTCVADMRGRRWVFATAGLGEWRLSADTTEKGFAACPFTVISHGGSEISPAFQRFLKDLAAALGTWEERLDATWWHRQGRRSAAYDGAVVGTAPVEG